MSLSELTFRRSDGKPLALGSKPVLVVRYMAAWCAPCQWHAEHTSELIPEAIREHVQVVDVVLSDRDNHAAVSGEVLDAWTARSQGAAVSVAGSPNALTQHLPEHTALPRIAIVALHDSGKPTLLQTLSAPSPRRFADALLSALDAQAVSATV